MTRPYLAHLGVFDILHNTRVNGPGRRNLLVVRGCTIKCPGCANRSTHRPAEKLTTVLEVATRLLEGYPDGITISGGEPFEQLPAIALLCYMLRYKRRDLSIILYTGLEVGDAVKARDALASDNLMGLEVDVIFHGPYKKGLRITDKEREGLCLPVGSRNQGALLLSDRHSLLELMTRNVSEVHVNSDGSAVSTGFPNTQEEAE